MSFAATLISKWYMSQEKRKLLLTHCRGVLIWLLQLLVLIISGVQPVCCSRYALHSSRPLIVSGMLLWRKHALETADL